MVTSGNFKILQESLAKVSEITLQKYPMLYPKVFKVGRIPHGEKYQRKFFDAGFGLIPEERGELDPSAVLSSTITPETIRSAKWFRAKYVYTNRAAEFDKTGIIKNKAVKLVESMALTLDMLCAQVLNNATNAAKVDGWDRLSLGNVAHKLEGTSATYSNLSAVFAGPSTALLKIIDQYSANIPDQGAFPRFATRIRVVVPRNAYSEWKKFILSPTEISAPVANGFSGGNSAIINPFENMYEIIPHPYLNDTAITAIVLFDEPDLVFYDYRPIRTRTQFSEDGDVAMTSHHVEWAGTVGFDDARKVLVVPAI